MGLYKSTDCSCCVVEGNQYSVGLDNGGIIFTGASNAFEIGCNFVGDMWDCLFTTRK